MFQQQSFQTIASGKLYLVPTPIGNLDDMTFRAVETLKSVDLILAEDTRHTQKLLNHFDIQTPTLSFHEHNSKSRLDDVIHRLQAGETIAQVSDAGMPAISDPGADLVSACVENQLAVVPLPGANAALTGLIASGLSTEQFKFIGFLPRKKNAKNEMLASLKNETATMLFYESPFRIKNTVADLVTAWGEERQAVVVRELTKSHEEFLRGQLSELQTYFEEHSDVKGEICFIVSGNPTPNEVDEGIEATIREKPLSWQVEWWMSTKDLSSKQAIKKVAKENQLNKREVYTAYHIEGSD